MPTVKAFVRLTRPHFLAGGLLLFWMGALTAQPLAPQRYLVAQVMITAAQVTAHYLNEYADLEADRAVAARTLFSGGSGVLVEGALPPRVALRAGQLASVAAVVAAGWLAALGEPLAALIGVAALGVSWAYSMPPVRLLGTGWGEVATSLVVVGAVPVVGALAQSGTPGSELWWAVAVLFPLHMAMLLGFELPDLASDAAAGKWVLAARIGEKATARLIVASLAAGMLIAALGVVTGGLPAAAGWAGAAVIPALGMLAAMLRRRWGWVTAGGVATLVVAAAGLGLGFLV